MKAWLYWQKKGPFLLLLIILGGGFLRFWGLTSIYQRVDDVPVARSILNIYHGDWRPDPIYFYPIFFNYLVAIILHGLSFFLNILRINPEPRLYPFTLEQVLTIARFISALLGTLTILVSYYVGRRFLTRGQSLLVSLLFSFSFIHILYSHQIVLDGPMTFFYFLSFYFSLLILQQGNLGYYLLAGFFSGLAIATKYNGVYIIFSLLLAHILFHLKNKFKPTSFIFSPKIFLAALTTGVGFFLGHPYAFFQFHNFIKASQVLMATVRETEWHLQPIVPETIWEQIKFNKYIIGLVNIYKAEGILFFCLIFLGLFWLILKGKKEHLFLALSALVYFLGALGFLGFYRYRDLVPLSPFYSFLALFSFNLIPDLIRRRKALRIFIVTTIMLILGYRTLAKTYYLWQDDTTQIASRWMKINLPERSWIAKEWFTPTSPDPDLRFRFSSRPYLFDVDLHPFKKYDYVISSSACSSLFLANQKFYPEWSRTYVDLDQQHELIKKFFMPSIEYKNPEIKIYSGRVEKRGKLSFWLPRAIPLTNPQREFQMIDNSPYEKDINTFFLHGQEKIRRFYLTETSLDQIGLFILPIEGEGEIKVSSGLSSKKIKLRKDEITWALIKPYRSFPFLNPVYRLDLCGSTGVKKVLVNLAWDNFTLGLNFLKIGEYEQAKTFFKKILENESPRIKNVEVYLFLILCCLNLAQKEEANNYIMNVINTPEFKRYQSLYDHLDEDNLWPRNFEKYSGIDKELWQASQGNLIEDKLFEIQIGHLYEGDWLLNRKGIGPRLGERNFRISSSELELLPQDYHLEVYFYNPKRVEGLIGTLFIEFKGKEKRIQEQSLILKSTDEKAFSVVSLFFSHRNPEEKVSFSLHINSPEPLIFDYLKYYPDLKMFLKTKLNLLSPAFNLANQIKKE
ncbi:MAG: glycosyltransferase family 39 protein [Candidatus Aminicenantes bacterium]|nr:glycosyltransferase family 39 protein [Candidatus Aminicenantes bacterium]